MKKQIIISIATLFLVLLLSITVIPANAQTKVTNQAEQKAWIRYEGVKNGIMSFDLTYNNPNGKKLSVAVYDEEHNNLFEGYYTDKIFHKRFDIPLREAQTLSFVLRSSQDACLSESFKINSEMKMSAVVTEL